MRRLTELCLWCICYHLNWDDEVRKDMDTKAPGESCSQGENIGKLENCHCFQAVEYFSGLERGMTEHGS